MSRVQQQRWQRHGVDLDGGDRCVACEAEGIGSRCDGCGVAQRAGGLRVCEVLAQTPYSRVYRAVTAEGAPVALKELLFASVPAIEQVDAFEREAAVLSSLRHPAIPRVLRSFREGHGPHTRLYLAVELVEGETLESVVQRGPLSEADAAQVCREVLGVLAYLHGRRPPVFHRDIKPANLIRRPDGTLAVVDFGSAREVTMGHTVGASLVGTFGYAPMEQLGGTVNPGTDLFALGATVLHLVSGVSPAELFHPGRGFELEPFVRSAGLRRVLERLLALDPSRRFSSAREAAAAVDRAMAESARARPAVDSPRTIAAAPLEAPRVDRATPRLLAALATISVILGIVAVAPARSVAATPAPPGQQLVAAASTWIVERTWMDRGGTQLRLSAVRLEPLPLTDHSRVELELAARAPAWRPAPLDWLTSVSLLTSEGRRVLPWATDPRARSSLVELEASESRALNLRFLLEAAERPAVLELSDGSRVALSPP